MAVIAVSLAVSSRAFATPAPSACSQLAHDQRVTGLEPGMWISEVLGIAGFVFFAVDAKPNAFPASLLLDLVAVGGLLSFAEAGCIVQPESDLPRSPRVLPVFKSREEARAYRAVAIRGHAFVMALNFVASGIMLPFVHAPASRIALGISTAFPLAYSLVNPRKFSPERDIDDSIPSGEGEARLAFLPEIDLLAGEAALGLRLRF